MTVDRIVALCAMIAAIGAVYFAWKTYAYQRRSWQSQKLAELYLAANIATTKLVHLQGVYTDHYGNRNETYPGYPEAYDDVLIAFRDASALAVIGPVLPKLDAFLNLQMRTMEEVLSPQTLKLAEDATEEIRSLATQDIAFLWDLKTPKSAVSRWHHRD